MHDSNVNIPLNVHRDIWFFKGYYWDQIYFNLKTFFFFALETFNQPDNKFYLRFFARQSSRLKAKTFPNEAVD